MKNTITKRDGLAGLVGSAVVGLFAFGIHKFRNRKAATVRTVVEDDKAREELQKKYDGISASYAPKEDTKCDTKNEKKTA